jgi:3',5'-nucleoside bisphosphate phosphatase
VTTDSEVDTLTGPMRATFDLQSHSLHSDGELEPAAVVRAAATAGVRLLALTDHDSVAGVEEALQTGREVGVEVIPATELSSVDEAYEELHILGYLVDHRDPGFRAILEDLRADRERRVLAMADLLRGEGFQFDDSELRRRSAAGDPLGRPHLAQAILDHPANARRLTDEGITGLRELFPRYLVPGAPTYVARTRPTVAEAIELIHGAGGVAVWAHPFWDVEDPGTVHAMLERFAGLGIDGVEAFYPTHTREQVELLCGIAGELGLLTTGSSDFHGSTHKTFAGFLAFELYEQTPRLDRLAEPA